MLGQSSVTVCRGNVLNDFGVKRLFYFQQRISKRLSRSLRMANRYKNFLSLPMAVYAVLSSMLTLQASFLTDMITHIVFLNRS